MLTAESFWRPIFYIPTNDNSWMVKQSDQSLAIDRSGSAGAAPVQCRWHTALHWQVPFPSLCGETPMCCLCLILTPRTFRSKNPSPEYHCCGTGASSAIWHSQQRMGWGCAFTPSSWKAAPWLKKVLLCLESEAVSTDRGGTVNVMGFLSLLAFESISRINLRPKFCILTTYLATLRFLLPS